MSTKDFSTDHLTGEAKKLAEAINAFLRDAYREPDGGGCRAFYTPEEWSERGEPYGHGGVLVLVHDGGDLWPFCNWDEGYVLPERFTAFLKGLGYWIEQGTSWHSTVFKEGN